MPDHGTLIAWSQSDGVGRIRLDGGDEVRVGQNAFRHLQPSVGHRCEVVEAEPHPLGGRRATRVELLDEPRQAVARAEAPPSKELGPWLLERIRSSSRQPVATVEVENLMACHLAFGSHLKTKQVFGIDPRSVEPARHQELVEAIETELKGWRDRLTSPLDQYHLDKAGRRLGLSFLRMQLPKLRCEPLGTTDGLDADWQRRISYWREAARGKRPLKFEFLGLQPEGKMVVWGKSDRDALYEAALTFEVERSAAFPRELAAMVCVADGLSVGETAVLRPIAEWAEGEDGLEIGSGSDLQGSLTLLRSEARVVNWKAVDRDDDGAQLHAFDDLGAFLDALLG